ncbi:MAG: NAD-dependent epimerase/dehydratase family protein [Steroidobacteraceae bacterium]
MSAATSPAPRVLIVGCGYVGKRLGVALKSRCDVLGIVSRTASLAELKALGLVGEVVDLDAGAPLPRDWAQDSTLFYLVPPATDSESDVRLAHLLSGMRSRPRVFVYMSTTGVYGDAEGGEVSEQTPVNPLTARARRRVTAEEMVRVWCTEQEVRRVVLRVPGIYGPGRLPLERLASREPAVRVEEAGIGNRIHVDDLVAACIAVLDVPDARGIYNVTDGSPLNSTEFLLRVARAAGLPEPPQISMDEAQLVLSSSRLSFLNESRQVSNRRMLHDLKVQLRYADVDAGIRQCLEEERRGQ